MCNKIPVNNSCCSSTRTEKPNVPSGYQSPVSGTSDVKTTLNTSDRVVTDKVEIFRGARYYVVLENPTNSDYVILKKTI